MSVSQDLVNTFYKCNWGTYDWVTPQDNNLWKPNSNTANNPCPAGYYVASRDDWNALSSRSRTSANGRVTLPSDNNIDLILPQAGNLDSDNSRGGKNSSATYWTSTPTGNSCYKFISYSNKWIVDSSIRGNAYPVRCVKL